MLCEAAPRHSMLFSLLLEYHQGLTARVSVLKIGLCRVIRISDIIIPAGTRLLVVGGEHTDGRGVGCRERLSLHIPQAQVPEDLFNHIGIFNENNDPHSTRICGSQKCGSISGRSSRRSAMSKLQQRRFNARQVSATTAPPATRPTRR